MSNDQSKMNTNILVATDVAEARRIFCAALQNLGLLASGVKSSDEVMHVLLDGMMTDSPYTTLLLDMQMVGMESIRVLQDVRNNPATQSIDVILLVSEEQRQTLSSLDELGYTDYLVKPVRRSHVLKLAQEHLGVPDVEDKLHSSTVDVLVVEDDQINQRMLDIILSQKEYPAFYASTGIEAIAAFKNWHFDIAFMDVHMPLLNGFETAKRIRAMEGGRSHLPIVALTASVTPDESSQIGKAGMDAYLAKPYNAKSIFQIIEVFVNRNSHSNQVATDSEQDWSAAGILDYDAALARFGGDAHIYHELLAQFLATLPDRLELIKDAIGQQSWDIIDNQAHNLRGVLANLGATRLSAMMFRLEDLSQKKQAENIKGLLIDIIRETDGLKAKAVEL